MIKKVANKIVVVGSGASGVHFALSLLQKGYDVTMLDVGHNRRAAVRPMDYFDDLKANLNDPVGYFLGEGYEAVTLPDSGSEYYGIPPSKSYVFSRPSGFELRTRGFAPLFSFAQGGLAEVWTAGVYPYNDDELQEFPFGYKDIEPYYEETARRIGITGVEDDLAKFLPFHGYIMEPLALDQHSKLLLLQYEKRKASLNKKLGFYLGRSRIATLSQDHNDRKGCQYLGRCLWGCPVDAIYTPSLTLRECQKFSNFTYLSNTYVSHFKINSAHRISSVVAESCDRKNVYEFPVDILVLATGTLSTAKIFLDSVFRSTGEIVKLHGLMDNHQILVPFVNFHMLGRTFSPKSYQYHQISLGIECKTPSNYIHGQITTLKTALIHPIVQSLPFDMKTSLFIFRHMHGALGIANINLHDSRREENYVTIDPIKGSVKTTLVVSYSPSSDDDTRVKESISKARRALLRLGCIVPPGMIHIRPKGASVHYAGTLPMSPESQPFTTSIYGRSHDFDNLYIADGSTFPFLPAKNITFTLMANAIRIAANEF